MTARSKEIVTRAMQNAKSDDLERAKAAFSGMADEGMGMQHGQSGSTRREILDGYQTARNEWETAMDELRAVIG